MSRYGIKVTEEEVRESILGTFGQCPGSGGESIKLEESNGVDSDRACCEIVDHCLDLTEILSLLLVPLLLKAEQSLAQQPLAQQLKGNERWPDGDLIEKVLSMMLHDATGDLNPRPLTKDLIRQILRFYGEGELADDDNLLDEMLRAANGNDSNNVDCEGEPILLDQYSFARALTHDVQRYNIDFENRITTNYFDVFETFYSTKEQEKEKKYLPQLSNLMMKTEDIDNHKDDIRPVQRVFTWASIDYSADTFRSKVPSNFHSWAGFWCLLDLF
jgi:hypothetical protein